MNPLLQEVEHWALVRDRSRRSPEAQERQDEKWLRETAERIAAAYHGDRR